MVELKVLQAVRLKGRVTLDALSATVDEDADAVTTELGRLTLGGQLTGDKLLKMTDEGRARLGELLADERADIDGDVLAAAHDDFRRVNTTFKALVSDWQLRDGQPNTHEDLDYDAGVLGRLPDVHTQVLSILDRVVVEVPRLVVYRRKLDEALAKINDGETSWLTRPIIDSYHTVWFELHEELIGAAGLTRADEAEAGHAG
ncbi:MAG: hypothetical protein QOD02_4248 [Mycobacterium sp.]|jgi:hypothetical protein|nr:hypothetical protein [Mycobacterium sp.]